MKWSEMDARERHALVAEKVMGWHEGMTRDEWPHWFSDEDGAAHMRAPSYTTEIGPAWQVVEKMEAEGFDYYIGNDEVSFDRGDHMEPDYRCGGAFYDSGKTPESICLAALRAKGVEI